MMRYNRIKAYLKVLFILTCVFIGIIALITYISVRPISIPFNQIANQTQIIQITDRFGQPLNISYQNQWNTYDYISLFHMPDLLKTAFIVSEDKRFYSHNGIDVQARASALYQNIASFHNVRGASTITEQVIRMINQRPRNLWSRWLEGIEAIQLENRENKTSILEFYLNQVPYAANRRGVSQAARYYFNRDLQTLSPKEILALAILIRAPSSYDLYKNPNRIDKQILFLAKKLLQKNYITEEIFKSIQNQKLTTTPSTLNVEARHFARYIRQNTPQTNNKIYKTTLNGTLQRQVQDILDQRLQSLKQKNVNNAAVLVANHTTGEILAWDVSAAPHNAHEKTNAYEIDPILTPRQPGSALKPFLYAAALEKGWNAATILDDSPLAEAVGTGLHNFKNYSNLHYGKITLREALGNSLNIPALHAIRYVGTGEYLTKLQNLEFKSLNKSSQIYDEGLALGNGEVTLFEMVRAYMTLANKGKKRSFKILSHQDDIQAHEHIFSPETTSLIGNILSDPWARNLEFGSGSILNLPHQTAVKTGTSTDYRDAWTFGYNDEFVVGIWMGNLNATPMNEVTGSTGPALVLRSIFSILNKDRETKKLFFSPKLIPSEICIRPEDEQENCSMRTEWFANIQANKLNEPNNVILKPQLVRPTNNLQIAYDPRIEQNHQNFRFEIKNLNNFKTIKWIVNDQLFRETKTPTTLWNIKRGKYRLAVIIENEDETITDLPPVQFIVK